VAYILSTILPLETTQRESYMIILFCISFPFRLGTVQTLVLYIATVCIALNEMIREFETEINNADIEGADFFKIFRFGNKVITNLQDAYDALRESITTINNELQWFYLAFFIIISLIYPFYLLFLIFKKCSHCADEIILLSSGVAPFFILTGILIYYLASVGSNFSRLPEKLNLEATSKQDNIKIINIWRKSLMDTYKGCFTIKILRQEFRITFGLLFTLAYSCIPVILNAIVDKIGLMK